MIFLAENFQGISSFTYFIYSCTLKTNRIFSLNIKKRIKNKNILFLLYKNFSKKKEYFIFNWKPL